MTNYHEAGYGYGHDMSHVEYGYDVGFGWFGSSLVHSVGNFVSNAANVAGKEIGHVTHVAGKVLYTASGMGLIKKIPIVGAPVTSVFSAGWNLATTPMNTAIALAGGERIDKVLLNQLHENIRDARTIAAYAQVVISVVPGIGTGVSAALGAGLALMNGQPISEVMLAAVAGAVPGGPLAVAAVKVAYQGIQAAASGSKFDFETAGKTGIGALSDQLGLPPVAKQAILAGVSMVGQLAHGLPPVEAISSGVIDGIPAPPATKAAMHTASDIMISLGKGERVDHVLLEKSDQIVQNIPGVSQELKNQIKAAATTGKGLLAAKNPSQVLMIGLQSGLADQLMSSVKLPKQTQAALSIGMAMGTGVVKQVQRGQEIVANVGKIVQGGIQLSKTVPSIAEGRKLVGEGTHGFDLAHGLLQMQSSVYDITAARNHLTSPADKKGFDMAMAQKIGMVTSKPSGNLSVAAHAGFSMSVGMQGYVPENKASMMASIAASPSASVGAKVAITNIAHERESWFTKLLKALGFHPKHT